MKNYVTLNNRTKQSQRSQQHERVQDSQSVASNTPSRVSIHSNPFKPIKDLLATKVRASYIYIYMYNRTIYFYSIIFIYFIYLPFVLKIRLAVYVIVNNVPTFLG